MNLPKGLSRNLDNHFVLYQHYYVREPDQNVPIATVAIGITKYGEPCRGIAICSCDDQFNREEGTKLAYHRLLVSYHRKESSLPINFDSGRRSVEDFVVWWIAAPTLMDDEGIFKSGYAVKFTEQENNILDLKNVVGTRLFTDPKGRAW